MNPNKFTKKKKNPDITPIIGMSGIGFKSGNTGSCNTDCASGVDCPNNTNPSDKTM